MKNAKQTVTQAVRELRHALHESQQAFAYRMKTAIRTIARYETVRPPHGKVLAQLEAIALQNGRADLATVFRQTLVSELGSAEHLTSPEERAWAQAICDVLRNRELIEMGNLRVQILEKLVSALRQLTNRARGGESLSLTAAEFESDLRNLEIAGYGSADYELRAAAKNLAKKEGIPFETAYAKELTPERYSKYESEHAELALGRKKQRRAKR
jgi:transcriptional regulator with XRE-family HTH domain